MTNPKESLIAYIQKHSVDPKKIEATGLAPICLELLQSNKDILIRTLSRILVQKSNNTLYFDAIEEIQSAFSKRNLPIVFIKGLVLANELFESPEMRLFGDLDIAIGFDHVQESLELLSSLGYRAIEDFDGHYEKNNESGIEITGSYYLPYMNDFGRYGRHFPVFYKSIQGKYMDAIHMDCHVCIFQRVLSIQSVMKKCMDSAEKVSLNGISVFTLGLYPRIIHLMANFIKETFEDNYIDIFSGWNPGKSWVAVNKVHDIALILHKNEVDWTAVLQTAVSFEQGYQMAMCLKIVSEIYNLNIPSTIMEQLNRSLEKPRSFLEEILQICLGCDTFELLFSDQYSMIKKVSKHLPYQGKVLGDSTRKQYWVSFPSNKMKYWTSTRSLSDQTDYFHGNISVSDKSVVIECALDVRQYDSVYPAIVFYIGTPEGIDNLGSIVMRITVIPLVDGDQIKPILKIAQKDMTENYSCSLSLAENKLSLRLVLDKTYYHINTEDILWNVEVDERGENGSIIRSPRDFLKDFNGTDFARFSLQ